MKYLANIVTVGRAALAAVNVLLYTVCVHFVAFGGNLALTIVVILLDAADGWLARWTSSESVLGSELDIVADRLVENIYWIYFACAGLISFWLPVIVFSRGLITDFVRSAAARNGLTAFGRTTHIRSALGRALVCSRASRVAYGCAKALAFCCLGYELMARAGGYATPDWVATTASVLTFLAVALCIVRSLPVIIDGYRYLPVSAANTRSNRELARAQVRAS